MRIEKPKTEIPAPVWLVLAVVVLFAILPFLLSKPAPPNSAIAAGAPEKKAPVQTPIDRQNTEIPQELPLPEPVPSAVTEEKKEIAAQAKPAASHLSPEKALSPEQKSLAQAEPVVLMTSFYGDVKVGHPQKMVKAQRNQRISADEIIEVGETGEAVLEVGELYVLRLKPQTQIVQMPLAKGEAFSGKERRIYRFKLEKGSLLGTTKFRGDKTDLLDLVIHDKVFNVQDSTFRVQLSDSDPWLGVLRGSVKANVENVSSKNPLVIRALEKVPLTDQPQAEPLKVSEQEWGLLRETYEMNVKTAEDEIRDRDLSKRAGDFFHYVFDHGTFYTESMGYTLRDFYEDKASGEVYLEAEYDVFSSGSYVGVYVLTRGLDERDYGGMRFDVRRKPDESYPDRFYIEMKSKGQIVQRFEITDIKPNWESRQIDFFSSIATPITEVTLVFLNESIGDNKKGYVQMKNFQMIPLTADQIARRDEAAKNPPRVPGVVAAAPKSLQNAVVTAPLKTAKKLSGTETRQSLPNQLRPSKKIADEVTKVVTLDDLSE